MANTDPVPTAGPPATTSRHPTALLFIFWGEFAERCSYYGMRAILPLYLTTRLNMPDDQASEWYYFFKMACYFLPLLGGILADRYLGKYWTIVGFSVPYVIGQLLIGIEMDWVVMIALALCAMGSGVIKPNISALLGQTYDQQRPGNEPLRASGFLWFYFSVNVGAMLSLVAVPIIRNKFGYQVAFLVPAGFMALALLFFAAGKKHYAVETVGPAPPMTPEERTEQWQTLTRLFGVFFLMIFFWVVYEHNDTQWTFFARDHINLRLPDWLPTMPESLPWALSWLYSIRLGTELAPDQFQWINAFCVLLMVLFFQWFWKRVDPTGTRVSQTTKILFGFLFTGSGPAVMALAANDAADGTRVAMLWIIGAYVLLTLGEVLVYGTMLDVSYAYAPARMKGLVTACFLVTNALGNLINSQYAKTYNTRMSPETFFTVDAAVSVAAAVAFFFVARQFNRGNAAAAAAA